jgi:hypothetical protein
MKKSIPLATVVLLLASTFALTQSPRRVVTAAQINGVYKSDRNDFRVLALGHHKLQVQFNGEWMTRYGYPNIGEAIGEATVDGNLGDLRSRRDEELQNHPDLSSSD